VRIDANQAWTLSEALAFAKAFPSNTFEYFEEPFQNIEEAVSFPYPIALDESLRTLPLKECLALPHVKALIIKPTLMGGCTKLTPLYHHAKEKEIAFILSSSYESELGISLLSKVAERLQLPPVPMGLDTSDLFEEALYKENITKAEGKLLFPHAWNLETGRIIVHEHV